MTFIKQWLVPMAVMALAGALIALGWFTIGETKPLMWLFGWVMVCALVVAVTLNYQKN